MPRRDARYASFLSTPSVRRATRFSYEVNTKVGISIHALREEGDPKAKAGDRLILEFLSTPSVRRAT